MRVSDETWSLSEPAAVELRDTPREVLGDIAVKSPTPTTGLRRVLEEVVESA